MSNEELTVEIQNGHDELIPVLWEQTKAFIIQQAKRRLILSNSLKRTFPETVELADLINSGYIALVNASKTYSADNGAQFLTWLMFFLKTEFNIAIYGGQSERIIRDPLIRARSLDAPLSDDEDSDTLLDYQTDENASDDFRELEDVIFTEQLHEALEKALETLDDDQREIIKERYYRGTTYREIAENKDLTVTAVQVKAQRGLHRLRTSSASSELRKFIEELTPYYLRVGVDEFNRTGISSVEKIVLYREKLEKNHRESE